MNKEKSIKVKYNKQQYNHTVDYNAAAPVM